MAKKPLFDVSRFNRIADRYGVPWTDRITLIDVVCWGCDISIVDIKAKYRLFFRALARERKNPKPVVRGAMVGIR
jgi:hypothetical protein